MVTESIFSKANKITKDFFDKLGNAATDFFIAHAEFDDTSEIHGFYKLVRPDGRLIEYRHHCPVSGDFTVAAFKGARIFHCPDRKQSVLDPDAAMPSVVCRPRRGELYLPDGRRILPINW
jgi:hypothetical protein